MAKLLALFLRSHASLRGHPFSDDLRDHVTQFESHLPCIPLHFAQRFGFEIAQLDDATIGELAH